MSLIDLFIGIKENGNHGNLTGTPMVTHNPIDFKGGNHGNHGNRQMNSSNADYEIRQVADNKKLNHIKSPVTTVTKFTSSGNNSLSATKSHFERLPAVTCIHSPRKIALSSPNGGQVIVTAITAEHGKQLLAWNPAQSPTWKTFRHNFKLDRIMVRADREALTRWLDFIGETDAELITDFWYQVKNDVESRQYFLGPAYQLPDTSSHSVLCATCQHFESLHPHGRGPGYCTADVQPTGSAVHWFDTPKLCSSFAAKLKTE